MRAARQVLAVGFPTGFDAVQGEIDIAARRTRRTGPTRHRIKETRVRARRARPPPVRSNPARPWRRGRVAPRPGSCLHGRACPRVSPRSPLGYPDAPLNRPRNSSSVRNGIVDHRRVPRFPSKTTVPDPRAGRRVRSGGRRATGSRRMRPIRTDRRSWCRRHGCQARTRVVLEPPDRQRRPPRPRRRRTARRPGKSSHDWPI